MTFTGPLRNFWQALISPEGKDSYASIVALAIECGIESRSFPNDCDLDDYTIDADGSTPLILAALANRLDVMEALLAEGADINASNIGDGMTPLHAAAHQSNVAAMHVLIANGACVDTRDRFGRTSFFEAIAGGLSVMTVLYTEGADVNTSDNNGNTLLHKFISNTTIIKALISWGVSVTRTDCHLRTPLHGEDGDVLEIFGANGADVNAARNDGQTPLHYAAYRGNSKAVRCLAALGADLEARDEEGRTPLALAIQESSRNLTCHTRSVIEALLFEGANPLVESSSLED